MKKNHLILIFVVLACILALGVYGVFYHALSSEVAATSEKESRIALLKDKEEEIVTQKKLIDESKEMRSALEKYFVSEEDLVSFLEPFELLGPTTGTDMTLSSVDVVTPQGDTTTGMPALAISISAEGTFSSVYHLLALLEDLPYEVQIGQVSLSRIALSQTVGGMPLWNLQTSLIIRSFTSTQTL